MGSDPKQSANAGGVDKFYVATRLDPELIGWQPEEKSLLKPLKAPGLEFEAARYFKIAPDDFARKAVRWRAEMIAHFIIKNTRDNWEAEQRMKKAKRDETEKKSSGFNPMDAQKRAWRL